MLRTACLLVINITFVLGITAQTQPTIDEILTETEKQTVVYQQTFRDLLAVETKTFEDFDKNQNLKKRTLVQSDFLVYQSTRNPKLSYEMRNVTRVDNKPIPNSETNADAFFAELRKATTLKSELEKIQKKSSKYDKTFDISGLTLYEGIVLSPNLRPYFEFTLEEGLASAGDRVLILGYRQVRPSPFIAVNEKNRTFNSPSLDFEIDLPDRFKKNEALLEGKLWVDPTTFQILREERELRIGSNEPLLVLSTVLEYQTSKYGILVPKRITLLSNQIRKKDGRFVAVKDSLITFEYTNFRKTETDVKILDDTEP